MQIECCEGQLCLKSLLPLLSISVKQMALQLDNHPDNYNTFVTLQLHGFTFMPHVLKTAFVYCVGASNTLVGASEFLFALMLLAC